MFLFGPSNFVKNGRFMVLHNIKVESVEIDTTVCILPFQTIKDQVEKRLKNRHKKQIENKPVFTETRAEKQETQRVLMYQMQAPPPSFQIRKQSTIVKLSLLVFLAYLFLISVNKLISFLKTKKLRKKSSCTLAQTRV